MDSTNIRARYNHLSSTDSYLDDDVNVILVYFVFSGADTMRSFFLNRLSDYYDFIRVGLKNHMGSHADTCFIILLVAVVGSIFFFVDDIISTINITLYFLGQIR